jgi:hypothetical protein
VHNGPKWTGYRALDEFDRKLLALLQEDARLTNNDCRGAHPPVAVAMLAPARAAGADG